MRGYIQDAIFANYGMYNVMGYEESDYRAYLTFTCARGTYVAVMAKQSNRVVFYKQEKEFYINED